MPRPLVEVDMKALWTSVAHRLFVTEKSARVQADLLGLSPQVFTDIKQASRRNTGYQPSAPTLLSICEWLGHDPRQYSVKRRVPAELGAAPGYGIGLPHEGEVRP